MKYSELQEQLADARELLAKFEYLPYGSTLTRRWVNGVWTTDAAIAKELGEGKSVCTVCGWPQDGHGGPGRYKGNAENTHEQFCSMYVVLHGEPAYRLRDRRERRIG